VVLVTLVVGTGGVTRRVDVGTGGTGIRRVLVVVGTGTRRVEVGMPGMRRVVLVARVLLPTGGAHRPPVQVRSPSQSSYVSHASPWQWPSHSQVTGGGARVGVGRAVVRAEVVGVNRGGDRDVVVGRGGAAVVLTAHSPRLLHVRSPSQSSSDSQGSPEGELVSGGSLL